MCTNLTDIDIRTARKYKFSKLPILIQHSPIHSAYTESFYRGGQHFEQLRS